MKYFLFKFFKMEKRLCITVMLLMVAVIAFSQKKLVGKVVDAVTSQPLQGATVADLQNNLHKVTDANGDFTLPQSSDSVRISSVGYSPAIVAVNEQINLISLS